jgi:hypothetical protein
MPVIPALRTLRQEDLEFKVTLSYLVRPYLKKKKRNSNYSSQAMMPGWCIARNGLRKEGHVAICVLAHRLTEVLLSYPGAVFVGSATYALRGPINRKEHKIRSRILKGASVREGPQSSGFNSLM